MRAARSASLGFRGRCANVQGFRSSEGSGVYFNDNSWQLRLQLFLSRHTARTICSFALLIQPYVNSMKLLFFAQMNAATLHWWATQKNMRRPEGYRLWAIGEEAMRRGGESWEEMIFFLQKCCIYAIFIVPLQRLWETGKDFLIFQLDFFTHFIICNTTCKNSGEWRSNN